MTASLHLLELFAEDSRRWYEVNREENLAPPPIPAPLSGEPAIRAQGGESSIALARRQWRLAHRGNRFNMICEMS